MIAGVKVRQVDMDLKMKIQWKFKAVKNCLIVWFIYVGSLHKL